MRPRLVVIVLVPSVLLLGAALYLKVHSESAAPASRTPAPALPLEDSNTSAPPSSRAPAPSPASSSMTEAQHQQAIDAEVDRLQQLAAKDDSESLSGILADLNHPDKQVRQAAIDAAKEFGSTDATPALKAAADAADDLQEKIAFLEAADFLSLPKLSFGDPAPSRTPEQIQADQERRAQRDARRQARMQQSASRAAPQPAPAPPSGAPSNP